MSLLEKLNEDLKAAMKAGDKIRLETIRGLKAQLKNREIEKGQPLSEEEELAVLQNAAKRRKEAIEQFTQGNRPERAAEEQQELEVIQAYLPKQMDESEIATLVDSVILEVGAQSPRDVGKVMGRLMPQLKGKADGKLVQKIVQKKLSVL